MPHARCWIGSHRVNVASTRESQPGRVARLEAYQANVARPSCHVMLTAAFTCVREMLSRVSGLSFEGGYAGEVFVVVANRVGCGWTGRARRR